MTGIYRIAIITIALLSSIAPRAAYGDDLRSLLDKPTCKRWKEVSNATLTRLRKANEGGEHVDLKLIELSLTLMDFCMDETTRSFSVISGLSGNESTMKRAARTLAALFAYYKEARAAKDPATSLKFWPALSSAAIGMIPDLRGIIEQRFGEGSWDWYITITTTPEAKRSTADQNKYIEMHSWLEPL